MYIPRQTTEKLGDTTGEFKSIFDKGQEQVVEVQITTRQKFARFH